MKKSRGIIVLICTLLVLAGLSFMAVYGVGQDKSGAASNIKKGLDLAGGVSITYQVVGDEEPTQSDMDDTIYKLQQRVDSYSTEAIVYQERTDRINIEIPGVSDADAILEELGKPGSLFFAMKDGTKVITGSDVVNAEAGVIPDDLGNNSYAVKLTITPESAEAFTEATRKALASKESIYIIYDDEMISAPIVEQVITGTSVQISNMTSMEAAEKLASQIRIGGLKLQLEELRSNVVGAQLGKQAIATSMFAGAIGLILVILFMIFVYRIPGVASSLALIIYIGLMVALLNGFDVTLTLPGIAGIILSIGMAVDANVIIFARIKEEIASGKTINSSIKIGFQKALSAIVDGNVTTLIAAAVLALMGTGSVKGFAQTLALGIVVSMFTALVITRLIVNAMFAAGIKAEKFYGRAKDRKVINFLGARKWFFALSGVLISVGIIFAVVNINTKGDMLNYGLEFKGGTSTNVTFNEDMSGEDLKQNVYPIISKITGDSNIFHQKVNDTNEVIFKTRILDQQERETLKKDMADNFSVDPSLIMVESISSTISNEMRLDAIWAIIVAIACMLIYVWFRFKDIRFAASAVLALLHDVLIVLTLYIVIWTSVGNTFIACMLTIVGYSINATIVIFDRIRENLAATRRKDDIAEIVNRSITQTLARSIFTSLTTFIMVAILYIFGIDTIKDFVLPLMVGIACGTYSSVCLTGAMWYIFKTKSTAKSITKKA